MIEFVDELLQKNSVDVAVFKAAQEKEIHRTIHAGEAGPAKCVKMVRYLYVHRF